MTATGAVLWAAGVVVLPLLTATLTFLLGGRGARLWAAVTVVGILACVAGLTQAVVAEGPLRFTLAGWQAPLGIAWYADGLTALMLIMTATVGAAVSVYAEGYLGQGEKKHGAPAQPPAAGNQQEQAGEPSGKYHLPRTYFWPLWFFLWGSMNAVFLAGDIFNIYVTLELLGLSAVALVTLEGSLLALTAALRYLLVSLLASLAYLLGVVLLYSAHGTVDLALLAERVQSDPITWSSLALVTIALMMKTALFPLHFWLPPAHGNAPAPVSAVLSGLVVKASFYLIVRIWFGVFPAVLTPLAGHLVGALGMAAIVWGSVQAIRQVRLKLLLAYSTVAQLGYLFLMFPLAMAAGVGGMAWSAAALYALSDACAKAALFMTSGTILHTVGHDRVAELDGIGNRLPLSLFAFGVASMNLIGLPPSGGFLAKWMLLQAAMASGQWWLAVTMILGGLLAGIYCFRVLGPAMRSLPETARIHDMPRSMELTTLMLALIAFSLGLIALQPLALLEIGIPFGDLEEAP